MGGTDDYLDLTMGVSSPEGYNIWLDASKAADVYGMGMIVYEASFHRPGSIPNLPSSRS